MTDGIMKKMTFIVYSQVSEEKLSDSLGVPEYSYYFVLKGYLPVLRELGQVIPVKNPEQEVDAIYDDCRRRGEDCVFLTFSPPNKSAVGLRCPTVCVIAWEYDRIPDEIRNNDSKSDWRRVFIDHGRAITLSRYSAIAVKRAMGRNFPVTSIPVPVWDAFEVYRSRYIECTPAVKTDIKIRGNIVDSRNYSITSDSFALKEPIEGFQLRDWNGETLQMGFKETDEYSAYLGGFFQPEPWGTWSRISNPWVLLPYRLSGLVRLKITACGYANNFNRDIFVELGDEKKKIRLKDFRKIINVTFRLSKPSYFLKFSGLDLSPVQNAADPRSMGIGLKFIEISGVPCPESTKVAEQANNPVCKDTERENNPVRKVTLEGVVYTSIFSPVDGRKNWKDIVTAFCIAFQDVEDATLVLKMSHHSLSSFLGKLHFLLQQLWPFKCRIVVLHGYMDSVEYEQLIAATHFYVNASKCEGFCLPLVEYMACQKPSISPCHTAMADYIDSSTTLIVESSLEPCQWPDDSRDVFRTMWYRISWESLLNAYRQSYDIAKNRTHIYREMGSAASLQVQKYLSNDVVKEKLQKFFIRE